MKKVFFISFLFFVILLNIPAWIYFSMDISDLDDLRASRKGDWVSSGQVSHVAKWAILVSEDWAFYDHKGIDYVQLQKVIEESYKEGALVRGASTISQQVVKNVYLTHDRSLWRKFKEFLMTIKLEKEVSKEKILETYLNIAELGKDIYGLKKASSVYFSKLPSELTAREGAFLAMLLPSPVKYSISFRNQELTEFAHQQVSNILFKLKQAKIITDEERIMAMQERFSWERREVIYPDNEESDMLLDEDDSYFDYDIYSESDSN